MLGLWLTSGIQIQSQGPDFRIPEEFQKIPTSCETGSKYTGVQIGVAVRLQRQEVIDYLCFLWCRLFVLQRVQYPVQVKEIKSVLLHAYFAISLYTIEVFDGLKYWSAGLCLEWRKQKVTFSRIKIKMDAFTICEIDEVTVVHVVG